MSITLQLRANFDLCNSYINELQQLLNDIPFSYACYSTLPIIKEGEELSPDDEISVSNKFDGEALSAITSSLCDFMKQESVHTKVARRHPGILKLPYSSSEVIVPYLDKINELKTQFKKLVLTIDNNDARFEAVHSAVPGIITLSYYRQIHFSYDDVYSLRFTWMRKHSTKSLTKQLALDMLERSSHYSNPRMIDQQKWAQLVAQEKLRVSSLSASDKIKIRRPIRVTPELNVRLGNTQRYHVSGALPFFVFSDNKDLKIGELQSYQPKDDPRKRDSEYLVERLYLTKDE